MDFSSRPDLRIQLFDWPPNEIEERAKAAKLDMGVGLFKNISGLRRVPFFKLASR